MIIYPMPSHTSKCPVFVFSICLLPLILLTVPYSFIVPQVGLTFLNWFSSYPSYRSFSVSIDSNLSSTFSLSWGVPQGFVHRPIIFNLYTTSLSTLISQSSLSHHLYTDDTQLFITFVPKNFLDVVFQLESTISSISSWMTVNLLNLNPFKPSSC